MEKGHNQSLQTIGFGSDAQRSALPGGRTLLILIFFNLLCMLFTQNMWKIKKIGVLNEKGFKRDSKRVERERIGHYEKVGIVNYESD